MGLGQFADLRRGVNKNEGVLLLREGVVDAPVHTMTVTTIKMVTERLKKLFF